MGPHPAVATVRRAVRTALVARQNHPGPVAPTPSTDRVLVACSGGADSLALAAALAFEAPRAGVRAGLITIDHGLQPGSGEQAGRVAAIGYELGLDPVELIAVNVGDAGGPEAAARAARYRALDSVASSLGAQVLLGHTLDDQAETVLLGLGRGSGPRSIAGMRAVDGVYLRPFLAVRRADTEAACRALGLDFWRDPQNGDPRFQRVRLRQEVLPLLEQVLASGVAPALARTAALLRDDLDALDAIAATYLSDDQHGSLVELGPAAEMGPPASGGQQGDHQHGLAVEPLRTLPRAIRTRVLRGWLKRAGVITLSAERTQAIEQLITNWHGQGPLDLPGGARVHRASGKLVLTPTSRD